MHCDYTVAMCASMFHHVLYVACTTYVCGNIGLYIHTSSNNISVMVGPVHKNKPGNKPSNLKITIWKLYQRLGRVISSLTFTLEYVYNVCKIDSPFLLLCFPHKNNKMDVFLLIYYGFFPTFECFKKRVIYGKQNLSSWNIRLHGG